MKSLVKLGGIAALGLVGASVPGPAIAASAEMLLGTWRLATALEGCGDVTGTRAGELWSFDTAGRFTRSSAGGVAKDSGRWLLRQDGHELQLVVDGSASGLRPTVERFPISSIEATRLELLTPTEIRKGVVIRQERTVSFFHS